MLIQDNITIMLAMYYWYFNLSLWISSTSSNSFLSVGIVSYFTACILLQLSQSFGNDTHAGPNIIPFSCHNPIYLLIKQLSSLAHRQVWFMTQSVIRIPVVFLFYEDTMSHRNSRVICLNPAMIYWKRHSSTIDVWDTDLLYFAHVPEL